MGTNVAFGYRCPTKQETNKRPSIRGLGVFSFTTVSENTPHIKQTIQTDLSFNKHQPNP
ncbi:hypothetical protein HMPREF6745_1909 [Prevotella sp. oral taxon 472 str. F0295]|nr:hypothetical protein HMPREF6745_1909 [Prevotella sp. oral taxon 472 str. F0295]